MSDNWFSVIIPNYNKEKFIKDTIESVLSQTYPYFELIVVDDGSTDNSIKIIKSFSDERLKIVCQENCGVSVARNNGILQSKYKYVAFLDSDDYWMPFYLEKMNQLINDFPNAGAYGCSFIRDKLKKIKIKNFKIDNSRDYIIEDYFASVLNGSESLTASTTVVKKSLFDIIGYFPEGLKNWEDFDMWLRVGLFSQICYTDCICAVYNEVEGSASRERSNLHSPVIDNYKSYIHKSGIDGVHKKHFIQLVSQKKCHAAYERFLVDRKRIVALKSILPFLLMNLRNKLYWSQFFQFVFTPEIVLGINDWLKRKK